MINKIIRKLFALAALFLLPAFAHADETGVIVVAKDGSTHEVALSELSHIGIGESSVTVHHASGDSREFSFDDVDRIHIGAAVSGISEIVAKGNIALWPTEVETTLNVAGLQAGEPVVIYTTGGAAVISAQAADGESTEIDCSRLAPGIYVVSFGSKSAKIVKK